MGMGTRTTCLCLPESSHGHPSLETELITDASPVGLVAILTQVLADGGMNIVA